MRSDGHQVSYLGLSRCEQFVRPNGFHFTPLFEKWFPNEDAIEEEASLSFWQKITDARSYIKHIKAFIDALIAGEDQAFFDIVEMLKPDLVVVVATHYDSFIWALLAYKAGIKTIYLHDTLCRSESILIPPITTGIIPDDRGGAWYKVLWAWKAFLWSRFIKDVFYDSVLGINLSMEYGVAKLCKHYYYPRDLVDTATDMLAPKIRLTEIVLCPKEFDFPGAEHVGRYYVGASIDLDRQEPAFPWQEIDADKPLIYCALGSLEFLSNQERTAFFHVVIDTARQHPEWCWVIALGDQLNVNQFEDIPGNTVLVNRAPQLSLLKKAKIMIGHGGTNSIKECIWFGVPMIVFPLTFDHYGNAARVVYQGLGLRGNIKKLSVEKLDAMLEQVNKNAYYHIQMGLMQRIFKKTEAVNTGSAMINAILPLNCG